MFLDDFCCFQFLMISPDQKWQLDITFSQLLTPSSGVKLSSCNSWSLWFADSECWSQYDTDICLKQTEKHYLVINQFLPYSPHRLQSLKPQTPNTKESASHHVCVILERLSNVMTWSLAINVCAKTCSQIMSHVADSDQLRVYYSPNENLQSLLYESLFELRLCLETR